MLAAKPTYSLSIERLRIASIVLLTLMLFTYQSQAVEVEQCLQLECLKWLEGDSTMAQINWVVKGTSVGDLDNFDQMMTSYMGARDITQGSLALTYQGRLVYAKSFSQTGRNGIATTDTLFRIASISKPITATAVMILVQSGNLSLGDKLVELLSIEEFTDPRMADITVRHLLQHLGGWDRNLTYDPMFQDATIAAYFNKPLPINKTDIVQYMNRQMLQHSPGTTYAYSNYGYLLLGLIIEAISGQTYEEFVKASIFEKIGSASPLVADNMAPANEASYNTQYTGPIVTDSSGKIVPYSDGGFNIANMDSHGGWLTTAVDLARFSALFDEPAKYGILTQESIDRMFKLPGNILPSEYTLGDAYYGLGWSVRAYGEDGLNTFHGGALHGTSSWLVRTLEGFNWAIIFNQRDDPSGLNYPNIIDGLLWTNALQIQHWPEGDIFDELLHLPTFDSSTRIVSLPLIEVDGSYYNARLKLKDDITFDVISAQEIDLPANSGTATFSSSTGILKIPFLEFQGTNYRIELSASGTEFSVLSVSPISNSL